MRRWIFLTLIFFAFTFAQPNINQELLARITIDVSEQRLACYDEIANKLNPPKVSTLNSWNVETDINPIDDSKTVYVTNNSVAGGSRYGETITLYLRCQSGEVEVFIDWDDYLGLTRHK
jgi:hypothetical protein